MRLKIILGVALLISGCATVPRGTLQLYTDAYSEMKRAAEIVYAKDSAAEMEKRRKQYEKSLAEAGSADRYFNTMIPFKLAEPIDRGTSPSRSAASAKAALDAGSLFNQALLDLASGKSVRAVQESVGALAGVLSLAATPAAGVALSAFVEQVERARAREELIEAVKRKYMIVKTGSGRGFEIVPAGADAAGVKTGHLLDILLDYLIEDLDAMYIVWRATSLTRVRELPGEGKNDTVLPVIASMNEDAETMMQYRKLLQKTRQYFAELLKAAENPDDNARMASTVRMGLEVFAAARRVTSGF